MHVHISSPDGEAKFWLEPIVALVESQGLSAKQLSTLQKIVEERYDKIKTAWEAHFRIRG